MKARSRGLVTIGVGEEHFELAQRLARTAARFGHATAVVTERPRPWAYGPLRVLAGDYSDTRDIWRIKLALYSLSPWEVTVFCDADALAIRPLDSCFALAEGFDLHLPVEGRLGSQDTWNYPRLGCMQELVKSLGGKPERAMRINGGYLGFARGDVSCRWFRAAATANQTLTERGEPREELAMMCALALTDAPLAAHFDTVAQVWAAERLEWAPEQGHVLVQHPWDAHPRRASLLHFGSYNTIKDPYLATWTALSKLCPP